MSWETWDCNFDPVFWSEKHDWLYFWLFWLALSFYCRLSPFLALVYSCCIAFYYHHFILVIIINATLALRYETIRHICSKQSCISISFYCCVWAVKVRSLWSSFLRSGDSKHKTRGLLLHCIMVHCPLGLGVPSIPASALSSVHVHVKWSNQISSKIQLEKF